MQKLIAGYLFQHKKCALPHIGTLEIRNHEAESVLGEKKIIAPRPEIHFTEQINDSADTISYIAANKHISIEEAGYQLNKFCEDINALQPEAHIEIPGAGKFYKDADGKVAFIPVEVKSFFLPDVYAERVIHKGKSHAILVGDNETNSAAMTEYFTEDIPSKKSKMLLWAALLFAIAAALIIFYLNDKNHNSFFGVSHKYEVSPAPVTYKKLP